MNTKVRNLQFCSTAINLFRHAIAIIMDIQMTDNEKKGTF
jgi:hypothetical protein